MIETLKRENRVRLNRVALAVSDTFGVSISEMRSKSRLAKIVRARQYFCFIAKQDTGLTHGQVGSYIERDHSTVTHSYDKIDTQRKLYNDVRQNVEQIYRNLSPGVKNHHSTALMTLEMAHRIQEKLIRI